MGVRGVGGLEKKFKKVPVTHVTDFSTSFVFNILFLKELFIVNTLVV